MSIRKILRWILKQTVCRIFGHKENRWVRMVPMMVPLLPRETPAHYYARCDRCNTILDDLGREG